MRNSNTHALLSELYSLLGEYRPEDFLRASEYSGITPDLKQVLLALAREANPDLNAPRKGVTGKHPNTDQLRIQKDSTIQSNQKSHLASLLLRPGRFENTRAMIQFAKQLGINVEPRPKESRDRLANRISEAILLSSDSRRSELIQRLIGNGDDQTQGWIDVIKGTRS